MHPLVLPLGALALALPLVAQLVGAQAATPPSSDDDGESTGTQRPVLTVEGQATVRIAPDQAVLRIGAIAQNAEASTAQGQVSKAVAQALTKLDELGIPGERVQTSNLALHPVYDHGDQRDRHEPRIAGYRATNTVQITFHDLTKIGAAIDACTSVGITQIEGLSFGLRDPSPTGREALTAAIGDARSKAAAMAAALDHQIAGVKLVREGGGTPGPPPRFEMARAAMSSDTPVAAGELDVRATVSIEYWLEPIR